MLMLFFPSADLCKCSILGEYNCAAVMSWGGIEIHVHPFFIDNMPCNATVFSLMWVSTSLTGYDSHYR